MATRPSDPSRRAPRPAGSGTRPAGSRDALRPRREPGTRRARGMSPQMRTRRNRLGLGFMVVLLVAVVGKLVVLQGIDGGAYAQAAENDRMQTFDIAAIRGEIVDRDGNRLAYSVQASRVVADPSIVTDPSRTALALTTLLDVPVSTLTEQLSADGRYEVLAGQVDTATTDAITELGLAGIFFEDDPVRLYPAGTVGGQIVGFVGRDGDGLAGIEQTYQDVLAGSDGERRVETGAGGVPIPAGIDDSTPAVDGGTVTLTIDEDLQFMLQQRLDTECANGLTTRGSGVVQDVQTGEIVAMATCPGYDPAQARSTDPSLLGNAAVSDVFEPGSVMKAVTLAAAVEEGVATPDTVLSVPGHIQAGDRVVTDAHDHAPIDWTVTGILAKSSNVGTIMLAREVGDERLEEYMRAFGLGSTTGVELPGESAGILQDSADWTASRAANIPIGQGVSVTALQMASVYQTIANGGVRIEPRLVSSVTAADGTVTPTQQPAGTRVVSESTADQLAYMLEAVVGPGGTAPLGEVDGFRVAGKTGTAQRANPDCSCYEGGGYFTTFIGFAPADAPRYVVAVDLERPTSSAEGGQVAAPVFADVMQYALTAAGVTPSGTTRPDFQLTGTAPTE
ncbi:peptidoglycan glycosyltransferase [Geodermatophilus sp. Leaf369]|uniref:peptidoglycan D,D-transpeptidase FtsI family protein n=1 Tax=Geodermatophilus sp. Leaf369 TaxID=1736354 RepID=UPI0006FB6A29|nr:penicillin-binding protein 2 [Geodermatophilus sp. Leaf369]KQS59695.1 peptidoglycan glycosyltransferase [Geodermatophilus sp. Leaf369]